MKKFLIRFNNHPQISVDTLQGRKAAINTAIAWAVASLSVTYYVKTDKRQQRKCITEILEIN